MALFTDEMVSSIGDLLAYEADLLEVASAAGIDLGVKIRLAQAEVGAQIEASTRRPGNVFYVDGAGWRSTGGDAALARIELGQVVVTPPLKMWHAYQSLALVFRDAHTRRLNDKYQPKWREYRELAKWAAELLWQTGVGLVARPIPRAPEPELATVGSTLGPLSLFVRTTWVRADGAEGAGSAERALKTQTNQALRATASGASPAGVTGWNLYVGQSKGQAWRQNETPLPLGASWTMPETGPAAGPALGDGQRPEVFRTAPRYLQRG